MLLPTQNTALRRDLEKWFRTGRVEPLVVGEFEDAALGKIVATEVIGITVVPTAVIAEAMERYGFVSLGRTNECHRAEASQSVTGGSRPASTSRTLVPSSGMKASRSHVSRKRNTS